jgi:hypothetical protein
MSNSVNFIHKLQGIKRDAHTLSEQATTQILELVTYLESPKFHTDTTVQVKDIFARLAPVLSTVRDIADLTRTGNRTFGPTKD